MYTSNRLYHIVEKHAVIRTLRSVAWWFLDILLPPSSHEALWRQKDALEKISHCLRAEATREAFTSAVFAYKDPLIRSLVWDLKYRGNTDAARLCGELLFDMLAEELADRKLFSSIVRTLLLPIPLSKRRERERGFNQANLIVRELVRLDEGNFFEAREDVLVKIKNTRAQADLSREKRLENLRGVFQVKKPELVRGRVVLLIDDVTTTGATFREARRELRKAGAREVLAYAVAH